ncbi:MAG: flagellar motor protein [Zetaproteobacteria bacterium CG12_big_fil_rev_8_21_14_0_65_54_13]|nr:MAG: flagellar motor protein [Zetaproteobacteria bacterium CG12_big_fil_rev_8_21_14_0_65_54_13]PIX53312.1 MAG: flagellar motor protein [Zetaproteobacteria bacterium CG_4_10_14_3_um_filter_54_28]PJA29608.1 MAG: flagellar motor protein [Zetaproteobacteria bacterium CG_4_9_14_3_um_filter_54_145]
MAKRDKKPAPLPFPSDPGAALFLELMMQMLAFFILLTSYAVIVDDKRLAAIGSLAGTFNPMPRGANLAKGDGPALPARSVVDGSTAPKRTAKELTDAAKELGKGDAIHVMPLDKETLLIRFPDHIAFASGHVDLSPEALAFIDKLAITFLKPEIIEIQIEGHTDATPTRGSEYASNWELSAARAMTVFHALEERGVPRGRMITAGMGDLHPVKGHEELSRRVDITLKFRPVTDKVNHENKGPQQQLQHSVVSQPGKM